MTRNRYVFPAEVMQAHLYQIEATDQQVNEILTVADNALEASKAAEATVITGHTLDLCTA